MICLVRENLWDYLQKHAELEKPAEIFGEIELLEMLDQFFNRAIYYAALGHERATQRIPGVSREDQLFRQRTHCMSWIDHYRSKLMTPREAVGCVESGMRVYIHPGCAEPEALVEALMERAPFVKGVEVVHLLTLGTSPYCAPEMSDELSPQRAVRRRQRARGRARRPRGLHSDFPVAKSKRYSRAAKCRSTWHSSRCRPPDSHGYCSFGVGVDTTLTAAKYARHVVAQVNAQMPRTYGDSFIHVSEIDAIVEVSRPLCEIKENVITDLYRSIGAHVSSLIEDGSVLQLGIGGIPDAVLPNLMDRRDLGRPHRTDLRQRDSADRGWRHQRAAQELQAAQDHPRASCWGPRSCSTSWTRIRSSSFIPRLTPTIHSALR